MSEPLTEPAAPAVEAPAPDPADAALATPEAPTPQPVPAWEDPAVLDLVDARAQALFQQQMAPLIPYLEQALGTGNGQPGSTPAAPGELNPWDESFAGSLDQRLQTLKDELGSMIQQVAAPLAAREEAETVAHGEERLKDILADDIARNGDFPSDPQTGRSTAKELVRPLADALFPAVAARLGETPRAAELAMSQAAGLVRQIVKEASSAGVNQETNRLTALANAGGEPGIASAGLETATSGRPLNSRELAMKYSGRANALRGTASGT